jgi:4-hydroxy 2-oxovalerate aldolase
MNNKVLDCTLRDGGYYTDWHFSAKFLEDYLKTIKSLPINIIEVGYLSDQNDNLGPFYHLDTNTLSFIKSKIRKDQKVFAMINFKEIKNANHLIKIIKKKKKYLDGIRFAIPPNKINSLNKIVKDVPYFKKKLSLNINLMYLSQWINNKRLIGEIFKTVPKELKTLAFVDSHGSITSDQVDIFFREINQFKNKINFGCHFHNNCGLALANSLIAKKNNCEIIDTTFSGMGRGAGNAETELFIAINDETRNKVRGYDLNYFLEDINSLKKKLNWGSSFAYAFASKNGYSQAEMMDLLQKKRLDPTSALEQISRSKEHKIVFKKFMILKNFLKKINKSPILIGGGNSQIDYGKFLYNKVSPDTLIVFSSIRTMINFFKINLEIPNKKLLIISGNEIKKYEKATIEKIIKDLSIDFFIVEKNFFLNNNQVFKVKKTIISNTNAENPLLLFGIFLNEIGIKNMDLAFFDGNFSHDKDKVVMEETSKCLKILTKLKFKIKSLTKTYLKIKTVNPWIYD